MGPEEIRFLAIMGAAYLGLMVVYGSIRIGVWVWSAVKNISPSSQPSPPRGERVEGN